MYGETAMDQRERVSSRTDAQLVDRSVTGEFAQTLDGSSRLGIVWVQPIVMIGDQFAVTLGIMWLGQRDSAFDRTRGPRVAAAAESERPP